MEQQQPTSLAAEHEQGTPPAFITVHFAEPCRPEPAGLGGEPDDGPATTFYDADGQVPRPAASTTRLRVCHGAEGLRISVRCEDDQASAIRATITEPGDPNLWTDDSLEFYFGGASVQRAFRQFVVTAGGTRGGAEKREDGVPSTARLLEGWTAEVTRDDGGWRARVFFPYAILASGLTGATGEICRFAVRRFVRSGTGRNAVSAPQAGWDRPDAFGWLLLGKDAAPDAAWVRKRLQAGIPGDWVLPHGTACVWKHGAAVVTCPLQDVSEKLLRAHREYAATLRTAQPCYAQAISRAETRMAALPPVRDVADLAHTLLELRRTHSSLLTRYLDAEHVEVCRLPGERLGYFGWPTVARLDDGTLVAASSGLRREHICPWGKTVLNTSRDNGRTWSAPRVVNDSPIDDRDAGVLNLGGGKLLVSWFTSDTRKYLDEPWFRQWMSAEEQAQMHATADAWSDELVERHLGSWTLVSGDGGRTWNAPVRAPASAPHGPIRLCSGEVLYLGKRCVAGGNEMSDGMIIAARSPDEGRTWEELGAVPVFAGTVPANYHEPHVLELPSGRLLGTIRIQNGGGHDLAAEDIPSFSLMQTESDDGGRTWSPARPLGFHGSPPHLLRHSSGVLILTYGYRLQPYGERVAFSRDDGATWDHDWVIRDDAADGDNGYPSTVELADGRLFTLCYQKAPGDRQCSLLGSIWRLPVRRG